MMIGDEDAHVEVTILAMGSLGDSHKVEKMTMAEVFEGSLGSWAMGDVFGFNSSGLRLCTMSVSSDDKVFILGDELWGILT